MTDDLIRLRGRFGQSEVNARGVVYIVNRWGCIKVPSEDVPPLLKVGGFHIASESDEGADHSTLSDVAEVVWHLETGKIRDTLLALVENTNALNFLTDRARPAIKII
jgi:hypothetical protein